MSEITVNALIGNAYERIAEANRQLANYYNNKQYFDRYDVEIDRYEELIKTYNNLIDIYKGLE